jgi:putative membrane protein insertion efficiency factor
MSEAEPDLTRLIRPARAAGAGRTLLRLPALLAECLVRGYQVALSPLLIGHCKFCPSCSDYCIQALREWGLLRGCWLAVRRLLRCHPFSPGGIDMVPTRKKKDAAQP